MSMLHSLFVSHGPPTLPLTPSPALDFLRGLGAQIPRPRTILVISAHFQAAAPTLTAHPSPETVHDFSGFPAALYALNYPAPGDPGLARTLAEGLARQGWAARVSEGRGLDHGAWVPLMLMYPEANIPVVQLSLVRGQGPEYHWRLGQALRALVGDGVLILASGSLTHNLGEVDWTAGAAVPPWVTAFSDWFAAAIETGDGRLLDYRAQAPDAVRNHPTEEHLLPLFVALGASLSGRGRRLHRSVQLGVLAMDAYAFD
jgi:4,5-DOPA dioxygenase extradiol